jgi:hypothetical protein
MTYGMNWLGAWIRTKAPSNQLISQPFPEALKAMCHTLVSQSSATSKLRLWQANLAARREGQ